MTTTIVQKAARIIQRTHAETLHAFYIRAAQALADAGLLVDDPPEQASLFHEDGTA